MFRGNLYRKLELVVQLGNKLIVCQHLSHLHDADNSSIDLILTILKHTLCRTHVFFLLHTQHSSVTSTIQTHFIITGKCKGKGLDTCYSATYMSQTCDQQRFTISEVAADWHEPVVPQRIMWPSIVRANGQLDQRCS